MPLSQIQRNVIALERRGGGPRNTARRRAEDEVRQLNQTLDVNSENIDQLLDNLLHVTENLKEFTETIKMRPYSLIRATAPREHKTGKE